jgi:hypothetical protein
MFFSNTPSEANVFSECVAPNKFDNELKSIQTERKWFQKSAQSTFLVRSASREIFWKHDVSSVLEKTFLPSWQKKIVAALPSKRCVLVHKNSSTLCQLVSSQRRATRSDVSFQTKQSESVATVELTPPHQHTSEGDSLIFGSRLLSIVTVTPS